jgi:glyoxylase-like metal-dependent hydrolase (beta-lactamase superfamily II)
MRDNLLPTNKYRPGFTPMVVNTGQELILFDTGNGESGFVPRPQGGWLAAQLAPAGFKAEQIDVVVLSHGHPDHIGGVMENGEPLFPNARYVTGAINYDS